MSSPHLRAAGIATKPTSYSPIRSERVSVPQKPDEEEDQCLPSCELFPPQPVFEVYRRNPSRSMIRDTHIHTSNLFFFPYGWRASISPKLTREHGLRYNQASHALRAMLRKSSRPTSEWYPPPPMSPTPSLNAPMLTMPTGQALPALKNGSYSRNRSDEYMGRKYRVERSTQFSLDPTHNENTLDEESDEESPEKTQAEKGKKKIDMYGKGHDWDSPRVGNGGNGGVSSFYGNPRGYLQERQA